MTAARSRLRAIRIAIAVLAVALGLSLLPAASASPASGGSNSPTAQSAKKKKKHKKKKKKKKKKPAAPAPVVNCAGEDSSEPNDSLSQPTFLPITTAAMAVTKFRCPSNSDFFYIMLPANTFIIVRADPDAGFDVTLRPYDQTGTPGAPLNLHPAGGSEDATFGPTPSAGTRYVEVTGLDAAYPSGSYTIAAFSS
jgi:hypothetical protein